MSRPMKSPPKLLGYIIISTYSTGEYQGIVSKYVFPNRFDAEFAIEKDKSYGKDLRYIVYDIYEEK